MKEQDFKAEAVQAIEEDMLKGMSDEDFAGVLAVINILLKAETAMRRDWGYEDYEIQPSMGAVVALSRIPERYKVLMVLQGEDTYEFREAHGDEPIITKKEEDKEWADWNTFSVVAYDRKGKGYVFDNNWEEELKSAVAEVERIRKEQEALS